MGCKKAETGMKMVEASRERIAPVVVDTAPCKEVILTGDYVDMTIFPMFLHHERDGQSYSDDNLVVSKDPDVESKLASVAAGLRQTARAIKSSAHSRMVFCFVQFFLQSNPLKKSLHTMKPLYPL